MQNEILNEVKKYILNSKGKGNNTICVMSPFSCNAKEGYMQRVVAIDKYVLSPLFCVHLDFESGAKEQKIEIVDERHLVVHLLPHDKLSAKLAVKIVKYCKVLYLHSAIRCKPNIVGDVAKLLLKQKSVYKIWDVHGVLPEEYVMQLNFLEAQNATAAEEFLLEKADCTLVISDAMVAHFQKKYNKVPKNIINTSVFTSDVMNNFDEIILSKPKTEPYNVVYAGNTMAWQNVPYMKHVIGQCKQKFNYYIFTHDIEDFNRQNSTEIMPKTFKIDSVPIEKVFETYKICHFGFALRDDTPVNNVATPTKIIEYIQFGIIPVFKSDKIGDFAALGLKYIKYDELANTNLTFDEYKTIAQHNYKIVYELEKTRKNGILELKNVIADALNL